MLWSMRAELSPNLTPATGLAGLLHMKDVPMEHWYALHTKPRKERMVRDVLVSRGLEVLLPVLPPEKRAVRRRAAEPPFFPRYLFARVDLDVIPLSSLNWMQGMTGVVCFGGEPTVVAEEVIRWLRARMAQVAGDDYHGGLPLARDARLRVVSGPLKGMGAIFDRRLPGEERARVLVQLLGQLRSCEIPLSWLEQI